MRTIIWLFAIAFTFALPLPPKKLAIYYGYPSYVNSVYSVSGAVAVFNAYDMVVFGAGLEVSSHPDYANTKSIINASSAKFYGYVDANSPSVQTAKTSIDRWLAMKCVGIFFNLFGFDYGINRSRQNTLVDYTHAAGLRVFANAWNPDDVFATVGGVTSHMNANDWYLAQSHFVYNGTWQSLPDWSAKSDKMATYASTFGSGMACITTTTLAVGFNQTMWNAAYYACAIYGFNASGWGEPSYSATTSSLPWRLRYPINGTKFTGAIANTSWVLNRKTNVGIHINTATHTVSQILD
jgi:hypothetical protein